MKQTSSTNVHSMWLYSMYYKHNTESCAHISTYHIFDYIYQYCDKNGLVKSNL